MQMTRHKLAAAGAAALIAAAAGTGVAYATGTIGSQTPQQRQEAILQDLAGKLGVSVDKLKTAIKAVASDQIDQALAVGKLTQAQADQLKQQLQSSTLLPFGIGPGRGPGFGRHGGFGGHGGFGRGMGLDAAATYLGLSQADLFTQLRSGKTLAQIAQATSGKTVDGLKQAMVNAEKAELDQAVKDGRITSAQESTILSNLQSRIDAMVNGTMPVPGAHMGWRGGMRGAPPSGAAQSPAGIWG